ncbi:MarR family transcriptional regulator [Patulibacter sp. NPDC049589]|uniref:GbsR/MarR family transcriptional regulator n=1 Tax=Patulibacter sp. NPDC049589 TaxID=3154731 RepID=UPI0034471A54
MATDDVSTPDLRFVERFALVLTEAGWPRMAARVFAYVLARDAGNATATELASGLGVSPAAVSGAVRYLVQVQLFVREREPGARTDSYALRDDLWYENVLRRSDTLTAFTAVLADGTKALEPGSPAARRLGESHDFFVFLGSELPTLMERWRATRDGA